MQRVKHYQELTGAEDGNMRISFAAHPAKEFFNNQIPVAVVLGIDFEIKDISLTGLTLLVPSRVALSKISGPQSLSFRQAGKVFFECPVIFQAQTDLEVTELQVLFDERGIDIETIAKKNAAALALSKVEKRKSAIDGAVPTEYKVFATDVLDFIADRRNFIEKNIAPFEESFSTEEKIDIAHGLKDSSTEEWVNLCFQGNKLVLPFKEEQKTKKEIKKFTEKLVTHELVGGTSWNRSFFKPMGYPGDFRIMNYMYDHQAEGHDTYSRYLHLLGVVSGAPIVSRMEYISHYLRELPRHGDGLYHVMSIGSGPAREVQRFLENTYESGEEGYSFTLVDQEIEALNYAIGAAYRSLAPSRSNVIVSGMNTSFTEMLRPMSTFRHMPKQHLIYSAGLLDYLSPKMCRNLTRKLYDHLKPGGTLLVGNVNDAEVGTYWPMEFILDWTLYFRNEQEMYDMAIGCDGADVTVEMDSNNAVYMLKVTKPA